MVAKFFPGVKAKMGRWEYFMVRMTMRDLRDIQFAYEFEDMAGALTDALQRPVNETRVTKQIVTYLQHQPDRFFNSIVIAGFGGEVNWFPVNMEADPRLELIGSTELREAFGVLRLDEGTKYYALDGQHRLRAIQSMCDPTNDAYRGRPTNFESETMSVVLVLPSEAEGLDQFKIRFRRLFGHLNRYAKPMDEATNIIMDEDDPFAISLRNLFFEHEFFKTVGPHKDSTVIDTTDAKNITPGSTYFTTIITLYAMCVKLLSSRKRLNDGWDQEQPPTKKIDEFKRFRPVDDTLDQLSSELAAIWTALLEAIPTLRNDPSKMRNVAATDDETSDEENNLLFRPVGQLVLASVVRDLLDQTEKDKPSIPEMVAVLRPLSELPWALGAPPWRHLWQIKNDGRWVMRSADRPKVTSLSISLILGLMNPDIEEAEILALKESWQGLLVFEPGETDDVDEMWNEVLRSFGLS